MSLDLTAIKARLAEHKSYRNTPIGANGNVLSFADIDALLLEVERLTAENERLAVFESVVSNLPVLDLGGED